MDIPLYKLEDLLRSQIGDKYIFGAEVSPADPNPESFDCSEILEWAGERAGLGDVPDGSMNQRTWAHGRLKLSVPKAIRTRGALLFRDLSYNGVGHVAYSLGDGFTIEARGSEYGVGRFSATEGRVWTDGGLIPGLDYKATERPPETVTRWVVFGRRGARYGQGSTLDQIHREIREAENMSGAAVVIRREEPKHLEEALDYLAWVAKKKKRP